MGGVDYARLARVKLGLTRVQARGAACAPVVELRVRGRSRWVDRVVRLMTRIRCAGGRLAVATVFSLIGLGLAGAPALAVRVRRLAQTVVPCVLVLLLACLGYVVSAPSAKAAENVCSAAFLHPRQVTGRIRFGTKRSITRT